MPAAARVGDFTSHANTPLGPGPGSVDVMIGGQPAWRAGIDIHVCPLANGPDPHVGGPVPVGSTSVMINGCPAVRMNDVIAEAGGPNTILMGCLTVMIGG